MAEREQLAESQRQEKAKWRAIKRKLFSDLRDLRSDEEPSVRSSTMKRAALYRAPSVHDVPPVPTGPVPDPDDQSKEAKQWRAQMAARVEALRWQHAAREARRLSPGNTWRRLAGVKDHDGPRPGMGAYPNAWSRYLLREGDRWATPLGRAYREMERRGADKPTFRALQMFTDPQTGGDTARIAEALGKTQRMIEIYLDRAAEELRQELERAMVDHLDKISTTVRDT